MYQFTATFLHPFLKAQHISLRVPGCNWFRMTAFPLARPIFGGGCWLALKSLLRLPLWSSPLAFLNWIPPWFLFGPSEVIVNKWNTWKFNVMTLMRAYMNSSLPSLFVRSWFCNMLVSDTGEQRQAMTDHYPKWRAELCLPAISMRRWAIYILFLTAFPRERGRVDEREQF